MSDRESGDVALIFLRDRVKEDSELLIKEPGPLHDYAKAKHDRSLRAINDLEKLLLAHRALQAKLDQARRALTRAGMAAHDPECWSASPDVEFGPGGIVAVRPHPATCSCGVAALLASNPEGK